MSHHPNMQNKPWLLHCESARPDGGIHQTAVGADWRNWVFAKDTQGQRISVEGKLVDGFFEVAAIFTGSGQLIKPSRVAARELCLSTLQRIGGDKNLLLGWVMVARVGEKVNIPPVYPEESAVGEQITRVVIFGDSLTDSGRLKQRLKIFPMKPYWLGRFSNGPTWPEYLAMATSLGIQNHAYGGASAAKPDALPGANIYMRGRDLGQFFVSGSIKLQINDYLGATLNGEKIQQADTTAFLIWAGANDYISKEPVSGIITTFLNSPEGKAGYKGVVQRAVAQLNRDVQTLYSAGARKFIMLNMPDLGRAPIVLQNTTYKSRNSASNNAARRIELAQRLTELTQYHNELLLTATRRLREELPESDILFVDAYKHFQLLSGLDEGASLQPQDFGYEPAELTESLGAQGKQLSLQQPCYRGSYLGTKDVGQFCTNPEQALFWDTVHPTTLTQCWQAWKVGGDMAAAGWIRPLADQAIYRAWCQTIVDRVMIETVEGFAPVASGAE
ncbi:MAG: SGNH/GDSL hydrolase family protein [Halioglobus sp.]|nr:SGNH/GDSL hydrolase family protein [Halioglobus sp.]